MNTYDDILQIKHSTRVALIGHINPDADALCSMVVFKNFLQTNFNIPVVDLYAEINNLSDTYLPILEENTLNTGNEENYDFAISLDCASTQLILKYLNIFQNAKHTMVIDHHNTNPKFGEYNIIEYCSSTCELIYKILTHFNYNFSVEDYGKIYAGIITDTNNLTVGNMSKNTFNIAGECYEYSNCENIYNHFFSNNNLKNQKTFACAIKNSTIYNNGRILISKISYDEDFELKAKIEDYMGIINRLSKTKDVELVCFIYPRNGNYYVSMRARKGYDVSTIAKSHGGGGHTGAAAFESSLPLEDISNIIVEEFNNEIKIKNLKFSKNPFKKA